MRAGVGTVQKTMFAFLYSMQGVAREFYTVYIDLHFLRIFHFEICSDISSLILG